MMFILRTAGETPSAAGFTIRLTRRTPDYVGGGTNDFFCDGDAEAAKAGPWQFVPVHDGWYADDSGGGVAVWGQGQFWEIRDTPFRVRETSADATTPDGGGEAGEIVNVRGAIFGV